MRRTRDSWLETPPPRYKEISSLRLFNGEDLHFHERRKSMMEVQKRWLDEQIREKLIKNSKEKEEKKLFETQTLELVRAQSIQEAHKTQQKTLMRKSTRDFNKRAESENRQRRMNERKQRIMFERSDLENLQRMREFGPYINPLIV